MPEETKRGSNDRNKTMALKKSIFTDTSLPAAERLTAAHHYVSIALLNKDNAPPLNKLIKEFQDDPNPEIRERALRLKKRVMKLRDLKEIASVPIPEIESDDTDDPEPDQVIEPNAASSQAEADFASTVLSNDVNFEWPPPDILFPPPNDIYKLGEINFTGLAARLRGLPLPALTAHAANEDVVRAALRLSVWVPIELPLLQKVFFALQYEPKATDPSRPAREPSRYWPYAVLFAGVFNLATAKHGYGSLHDPPPNPSYVRDLVKQSSESSYVRLEALPRAVAAARLYRHLPVFDELLKAIEGAQKGEAA